MCEVPARYGDAVSGLRLRVFDPTENQLPDWVDSTEIGQHLRAVVTWDALVVPVELSRKWGPAFFCTSVMLSPRCQS